VGWWGGLGGWWFFGGWGRGGGGWVWEGRVAWSLVVAAAAVVVVVVLAMPGHRVQQKRISPSSPLHAVAIDGFRRPRQGERDSWAAVRHQDRLPRQAGVQHGPGKSTFGDLLIWSCWLQCTSHAVKTCVFDVMSVGLESQGCCFLGRGRDGGGGGGGVQGVHVLMCCCMGVWVFVPCVCMFDADGPGVSCGHCQRHPHVTLDGAAKDTRH
jgi:hypothetical protein